MKVKDGEICSNNLFLQSKFYQIFTFVNTAPVTFRLTPATYCTLVTEKSQDQRAVIKKLHMTICKNYSSYMFNRLIVLVKYLIKHVIAGFNNLLSIKSIAESIGGVPF